MEKWDVYDFHRNKIGKQITRGGKIRLKEDEYHLTVHIAVFNKEGKLLIQRRCKEKATFANMWDITCGGAVLAGENSQQGAKRELFEEVGIDADFSNKRPQMTINFKNCFGDYYSIVKDVDPTTLVLQESEVAEVAYASEDEIIEKIDKGEFIPYRKGFIKMIFEMKGAYGAFNIE